MAVIYKFVFGENKRYGEFNFPYYAPASPCSQTGVGIDAIGLAGACRRRVADLKRILGINAIQRIARKLFASYPENRQCKSWECSKREVKASSPQFPAPVAKPKQNSISEFFNQLFFPKNEMPYIYTGW